MFNKFMKSNNFLKNVSDEDLIKAINKGGFDDLNIDKQYVGFRGAIEAGLAEMMRRLKNSINRLSVSTTIYSIILIILTLVIIGLTLFKR